MLPRRMVTEIVGLACETDALARAGFERRHRFEDFTMIDVPERRDFWFGNALVLDREPTPSQQRTWLARHAELFAGTDVRRAVLVWEVTGERIASPNLLADDGVTLDRSAVFVRREPFPEARPTSTIREFDGASDWEAAADMSCAEFAVAGSPLTADFARWQFSKIRDAARAGRLRMWGAWDAGVLVAFAGMHAHAALARFATPVTLASHRGRGYFRTLCAIAVNATLHTHPNATVVVCATIGGVAADVYRWLGFTPVGEQRGLVAEPAS